MEINTINLPALHNEEHFQFQKGFKELGEQNGSKDLNIEVVFDEYLPLFKKENEALNKIRKSATTDEIELGDKDRDITVSGLTDVVHSQLKHFNPENRAAAARYQIMLSQYGNIVRKAYDDETAAIHKLVQESRGKYAADIKTMDMVEWINVLDTKNLAFEALENSRHSEEAKKTLLVMKIVRVEVDTAYREIVKRVNALIVVNGPAVHEVFVRELNARIDKVSNTLAQRKGRSNKNAAKKNNKDNTQTTSDTDKE